MKVWIKAPFNDPVQVDVLNELRPLQGWVNGYIETVFLDKDLIVICNEEARLYGMTYNCKVRGISFYGTIIIVGWTRKEDGEEDFTDSPLTLDELMEDIEC